MSNAFPNLADLPPDVQAYIAAQRMELAARDADILGLNLAYAATQKRLKSKVETTQAALVAERTAHSLAILNRDTIITAHAHSKLKEVHDRDGSPIALEGLKRIEKFYKIEEAIRGQSAEQRRSARQEQTKPLMDDFEVWLETQRSRISAKSRLDEKLSYIAKYMDGLKLFLDDGSVEMDSNIVERAIRPIALNRKNALFAGHDEGGRTWARIASLIETCKLNGVEPYVYLKATLEAIAKGHPSALIDELMPWKFDKQA
jgi:hypothetical protein